MGAQKNTVLFVDDEPHVLTAIRRAVIDEPFDSLFAGSAKEALQLMEQKSISVIVTDMRMPVMDGLVLLRIVREKYPRTIRMVLSGYTQLSQVLATVNQGEIFQFISKPWQMEEELLSSVRQAIERYNIETEKDSYQDQLVQKNQAYLHIFRAMEQKLIHEKRDLSCLKNLGHWLFSFWKKQLDMGRNSGEKMGALHEHVETIEEIFLAYMNILPTALEERTIEQTIEGIVNSCNRHVAIELQQNISATVYGHFSFLELVFKYLSYLQDAQSEGSLLFSMLVEQKESGYYFVVFEEAATNPFAANPTRYKIAVSMLNEIGKTYRIRLIPQTEAQRVRIVWQAQREADN